MEIFLQIQVANRLQFMIEKREVQKCYSNCPQLAPKGPRAILFAGAILFALEDHLG
jgi:hypothetical protein